jgi:mannan endo-1,4-beta-mannosidase
VPLTPNTLRFYTDPKVVDDFKNYIEKLLTHVNTYTGLTYAQDPTIIGYETGNELGGIVFGDKDVPVAWTREICQYIKQLGPQKLCIDGTYGINTTHFAINEVDIFSDHFYPLNITKLTEGVNSVKSANRVYLAGEFDWTGLNGGTTLQGDSLESFYDNIQVRQNTTNPTVAGALFWSLFEHNVPDCEVSSSLCEKGFEMSKLMRYQTYVQHSDGFTMQYGNPNNTDMVNGRISLTRQHFFAMQNVTVDEYLPSVACPHNFIPGYDAQYTYL